MIVDNVNKKMLWNKCLLDNMNNNMAVNDVRLGTFDGSDFNKGAGAIKTILWYIVNALIVRASWNPFMGIKIALLRAFGAKIGKGTVIKNNVIIKSP